MPTANDIQNTILTASLLMANDCIDNLAQLNVGNSEVYWASIRRLNRNITALQYQHDTEQYTSSQTVMLYNCLNSLIGFDTTVNNIDPNFQNPAIIIEIEGGNGLNVSGPIFFNAQTVTISNWQTSFVETYGNYPDIDIYDLDGFPQTSTTARLVYPGNDPTQPLASVTWGYVGVTQGYYIIKGQNPNVSGGGGGGVTPPSASLPITNNSAVLLDDATLNSLYPLALWGQLILLPNVPAKYEKLDNSPTGQWDLQTYTPSIIYNCKLSCIYKK